jgi:plastocyanin
MADHTITLLWNSTSNEVTVRHSEEVTIYEPTIGDKISFVVDGSATFEVTFENGSNFSYAEKLVIRDSTPLEVSRPGGFQFQCAVIDGQQKRDQGSGGNTSNPGPKKQSGH